MIPAYTFMNSHPFQKNQTAYQYPNMEHIPYYMMMDPARSYMPPMPVYSCCDGGNIYPGCYGFRPPCLAVPPHHHMHCYGGYPSCPEPYYFPYVPPPHYNVEQPRYEFDKNMMMRNHHCCGCPNSLCGQNQNLNQNEGKCVRIEEEKPDVQRKRSLVPFKLGDNQWPIVWIPPDYMGREKEREPSETETAKQEKEHHGSNLTEKGPKFWNGWPLSDVSRLGSWLPDGEGMGVKSVQNEQQEDGKKELPFPIIGMPARQDVQNMDAPKKPTAELSTIEGPEVVKTRNQRNISEKDMDQKTEDTKEIKERRCISIPVATVKDNEKKESSRNNVKRQSSSSPKKSRLPPVCLRVDPLPKKKNSNGSSKSPSSQIPTAAKENSRLDAKVENATVEHASEKIIQTVEVRSHESPGGNQENKEIISGTGELLSSPRQLEQKFVDNIGKDETEESTGKEDGRISDTDTSTEVVDEGLKLSSEDLATDEGKKEKPNMSDVEAAVDENPNMSDVEAAVLIQSAYRGYEVRKWELLKKMKQLVEVRQQIIEVQNRVKALGLAPQDEKERMFTGEMIMRLLLKLDTIQGLHPSVREFRKSLAKELVSLQEKLDRMMMTTKPTEAVQEATKEKPAEQIDEETHNDRKEEEQDEADVVAVGGIFSEEANESNGLLVESKEVQPLCGIDNMAGFEGAKSPAEANDDRKENEQDVVDVVAIGEIFSEGSNESDSLLGELKEAQSLCGIDNMVGFEGAKSPVETHDDMKGDEQDEADIVAIGKIFSEGANEAQPLHKIDNMDGFEGAKSSPADLNDENSKACEAEQVVELREPGVKNEDTFEWSPQNFSKQLEGVKIAPSLIGDKKPEEAESTAEMEQNVEMVTDEVQTDMEGQTDNFQATISVPDENGQTEDHLAADEEVPMKLKHIEMREIPEAEQNEERSSHTKCENGNGAFDQSAELPGEQSNSNSNMNIETESVTSDEEEKMVGEVQHQQDKQSLYRDENIQNNVVMEKMAEEMDKRLVEENEKMKEMVEKLMKAGKEQIAIITKLSGRVKELEKRLARKRKLRGGCGKSVSRQHPMLNGRIKT